MDVSISAYCLKELIQNGNRFDNMKNALKSLHNMDFDKLICSASFRRFRSCTVSMLI